MQNKHLKLTFSDSLKAADIELFNDMSYWINQSFVIWLWSILEQYKMVGKDINLEESIPGYNHVNLLRRMRNVFSHTNGRYNPKRKDEKDLFDEIILTYKPSPVDPRRYNLHINEVLRPLYLGVKQYAKARFIKGPGNTDLIETMIMKEGLSIVDVLPYKDLDLLALVLNNGVVLQARLSDFERLKKATPAQLKKWHLIGGGMGINWEALDEDLSLRSFIRDSVQQETFRRLSTRKAKRTIVGSRAK